MRESCGGGRNFIRLSDFFSAVLSIKGEMDASSFPSSTWFPESFMTPTNGVDSG